MRTFQNRRVTHPTGEVVYIRGLSRLEKTELERQALAANCQSCNEYMLGVCRWLIAHPDAMKGQTRFGTSLPLAVSRRIDPALAIANGVWPWWKRGRPKGSRNKKIRGESAEPIIATPLPDLALKKQDTP